MPDDIRRSNGGDEDEEWSDEIPKKEWYSARQQAYMFLRMFAQNLGCPDAPEPMPEDVRKASLDLIGKSLVAQLGAAALLFEEWEKHVERNGIFRTHVLPRDEMAILERPEVLKFFSFIRQEFWMYALGNALDHRGPKDEETYEEFKERKKAEQEDRDTKGKEGNE